MHIIKIGGSLLFDFPFNRGKTFFKSLLKIEDDIIIVHGTGSYSKKLGVKYGYYKTGKLYPAKVPVEDIKHYLMKSHTEFMDFLVRLKLKVVSIDLMSVFKFKKNNFVLNKNVIDSILKMDMIPVLRGDIIPCDDYFKVVSSDLIVKYLSYSYLPENIIFLTKTSGLLDNKGNLIGNLTGSGLKKRLKFIKESKKDVSGGMKEKIKIILSIMKRVNAKIYLTDYNFDPVKKKGRATFIHE